MPEKYRTYQIGEIVELTGLSHRALRYYEEQGLLDKREHGPGRFRIYTEADLERINGIKRLKEYLGLSLQEARRALERDGERKRLIEEAARSNSRTAKRKALRGAREIVLEEIDQVRERRDRLEELEKVVAERLREVELELHNLGEAKDDKRKQRL
jgi:MerR family transcriptional regulator, repressor of the yfmOP operon